MVARSTRAVAVALLGLCSTLPVAAGAPAQALPGDGARVEIVVPPAPGPQQFNRVWVRKYGPGDAGHVLILVAGSPSGQGNFDALAAQLVARVPGLAVWTLDRRENALEDVTGFLAGDADAALGYYFLGEEVAGRRSRASPPRTHPSFATGASRPSCAICTRSCWRRATAASAT